MKTKWLIWCIGIVLMLSLIYISFITESPFFYYAASGVPMLLVPFLPNLRVKQIVPLQDKHVKVVRMAGSEADGDLLVVSFTPGYIRWGKTVLYIPIRNIPVETHAGDWESIVALKVSRSDLTARRPRRDCIAISLASMKEKTKGKSFSLRDVNRLIVRMQDVTVPTRKSYSRGRKMEA